MERVDISILGREYSLACEPAEKQALLDAVKFVDQRMLAVKSSGKISSNERIAVMASIQIAAEMLSMRAPDGPLGSVAVGDFKRKLDEMHGQLNLVLPEAKPE
ncbi:MULTISPECIES: cell division protein ZapA [Alcaligenaceae]|jgi:cell division protein ZapA|uniref:Cell division protein ZapA n=1 Tax=Neopusillimonas maritima TaxID=2026239 RepID=A0A3A1YSR7_9BURK|nr:MULTISPECIES: cell division protein ZapA [Alcaligenaceae]MBF22918.1 cell division protein ZapA [Pusillimonas sp.]QIM50193.1 cell division protein ZapA [Pusillimonas sp. DMV24BSW_D]RII81692.1 cell division protein ZapA [Neopusillimonas maritima]RIY39077.1 cell division protein ZapA [Neopusillimonas maritima]|tara:strand:- start:3250 stop:3558 length:309 start_codon:yes stop_codon:yes gene_type:complete